MAWIARLDSPVEVAGVPTTRLALLPLADSAEMDSTETEVE